MFDAPRLRFFIPKPASPARLAAMARRLALEERETYPESEDNFCDMVAAVDRMSELDQRKLERLVRRHARA